MAKSKKSNPDLWDKQTEKLYQRLCSAAKLMGWKKPSRKSLVIYNGKTNK